MKIAIIDYDAGNLRSVANALDLLQIEYFIAKQASELEAADKIILPGVGAAGSAMQKLISSGFAEAIKQTKKPLLGICLGLQLFADFSEEENTDCLGIIPEKVKLFPPFLKTPQMGWNQVNFTNKSPLFEEIPDASYFYFVHSYYLPTSKYTLAQTDYGITFSSVVQKDNFYATQFHPEKSGELGLKLLSNFCKLC